MSAYEESVGQVSVGKSLEGNVAFSINHPLYRAVVDSVERKVAEFSASRGATRSSATPAISSVALQAEEFSRLSELYPEFRLVNAGNTRPAHAVWTQERRLGLHWVLLQAQRLSASVGVFGTPLVEALLGGWEQVKLLVDSVNPLAVHERHASAVFANEVYRDHVAFSREVGFSLDRRVYDRHLQGSGVSFSGQFPLPKVEVICVDGGLYPYCPVQVATLMQASEASVALGFFIYHPEMLMNDEGEVPGTGFGYVHARDEMRFKYPEGVAGVPSYPAGTWRSWLTSHTFSLGVRRRVWFQFELLKHRGSLMFYRMVKLAGEPEEKRVIHALELPQAEQKYVFTSWRLKALGADPSNKANWVSTRYLAPLRLVDRVYQFAMQLPREQFTRFAVRKQISVVNDRVTVEGTTVRVNPALGERAKDALMIDLFTRAFVDRYEAGTLSEAARKYADVVAGFSALTGLQKAWVLLTMCAVCLWEYTFGTANNYLRAALDFVRGLFGFGPELAVPAIQVMPSYIMLGDYSGKVFLDGGVDVARELGRRAALHSVGFMSSACRVVAGVSSSALAVASTAFRVENFALFDTRAAVGGDVDDVVALMRSLNSVDEAPYARRALEMQVVAKATSGERHVDFSLVADPVYLLNELYSEVFPGVAEQNLEYDTASVSLDPQDRSLCASYLRLPKYFGEPPKPKMYYHSRLRALNVPKRQQTLQELLSATAARNLNAPQVSLPQDDAAKAREVWEVFLQTACVENAKVKLARFRQDVVSLEEEAFREWVTQSSPDKFASVRRELEENSQALAEMPVDEYLVMLKADVKPSLSTKPLQVRTEPQVIVYHEKALSSFYSCMFRVLVRRFLAVLKPNYHVNLLKDTKDMQAFVQGVHPFGARALKYLENDFSKFDKSQGKFAFILEEMVFRELGLNEEFLQKWVGGHVECSLRSVSLGMSLHVLYQRKSGDATTAFGNVLLNVLSVCYAYRGTQVVWALFMGDDSLVCATVVAHEADAVAIMAEVFNLGAKTYMTTAPYFASNFVLLDGFNRAVHFVPDPVKRVERWSMMVNGDDPQWHERYVSANDSLSVYLNSFKTSLLQVAVAERYNVDKSKVSGTADAVATLLSCESKFRGIWEEFPQVSQY